MKLENVRIPARPESGCEWLAGLTYTPEVQRKPTSVVLAHGFTSAKHSVDSAALYFADRGYESITFDAVGHKLGSTGGRMERIAQAAENLKDAVDWTRATRETRAIALVGHSMGAAAAIHVAAREAASLAPDKPVVGIACICMGINPNSGFETPLGAVMQKQRSDYVFGAPANVLLGGLDEMLASAPALRNLPVLLVAAKRDILLPVASVEALAGRIGSSARLEVIDAMHLDAPDKARGLILSWLEALKS